MLSVRGICYLADRKRVGCRPGRDTPVSKLLSSGEMSLRFPYYHWWQICFHQLVSYGKNMEKLYTYIILYPIILAKILLYTYGCRVFLFPNGLCRNVQFWALKTRPLPALPAGAPPERWHGCCPIHGTRRRFVGPVEGNGTSEHKEPP